MRFFYTSGVILALFLGGCATKQEQASFETLIKSGDYQSASNLSQSNIDNFGSDKNLWILESAISKRNLHEYNSSNYFFDKYEEIFKAQNDNENLLTKGGATLTSTLVNDSVLEYQSKYYEIIMVNSYKALNFMALNRYDDARVEFNRAIDRQRRAKEYFQSEIDREQEKLDKKRYEEQQKHRDTDFDRNIKSKELDSVLNQKYSTIYNFEPYPKYINPFTTYMAGLFFLLQKDYPKATDLLKEAYSMTKNRVIGEDLKLADSSKRDSTSTAWIILENGLSLKKVEERIDIPLFLATSKVAYTGIALPQLEPRGRAFGTLEIKNSVGEVLAKTESFADMDRVIKSEFKKDFPFIVAQSVISAITKAYIQYEASKQGVAGLVVAGIYGYATTSADTRMSLSFPSEFQLAKVKIPQDKKLIVNGEVIQLSKDNYSIIYIKAPTNFAKQSIEVFKFN